jgi:hypothetical protein
MVGSKGDAVASVANDPKAYPGPSHLHAPSQTIPAISEQKGRVDGGHVLSPN